VHRDRLRWPADADADARPDADADTGTHADPDAGSDGDRSADSDAAVWLGKSRIRQSGLEPVAVSNTGGWSATAPSPFHRG